MKEKTKKIVKRLSIIGGAIVSVLIVLAIVLSLTACSFNNSEQENGANAYPNVNAQLGLGPNVVFTFSETTVNEETNSVSKTITATVLPEDAPDKSVDWSIAWNENNEGEDAVLSDYISLTPLEDGSNVATVTCYKGFAGSTFMIWVRTRVGGFAKNCIVRYVGTPNSLEIVQNGGTVVYDEAWGKNIIQLTAGETYEFDLALNNVLNDVSSDYVPDYSITGVSYGQVRITKKHYTNTTDNPEWILQSTETVSENLKVANFWGFLNSPLLSYSIKDGKLELKAKLVVSALNSFAAVRGSKTDYCFAGYVDETKLPYLELTVTDNNSNVSKTICIRTISTVQSVSLSDSEITF